MHRVEIQRLQVHYIQQLPHQRKPWHQYQYEPLLSAKGPPQATSGAYAGYYKIALQSELHASHQQGLGTQRAVPLRCISQRTHGHHQMHS